jgi:MFS family permease
MTVVAREEPLTVRRASGYGGAFAAMWLAQVVSLLGSGLTWFALGVWIFQQTGSATRFALLSFCAALPGVVFAPLAGVLVDRWDRRRAMMLGDAGSGLCTLVLVALVWSGRLAVWHIYAVVMVSAAASALQALAFNAATTLVVPKRHLGRASGLSQLGLALSHVLAPVLAGMLIGQVGLGGVLLIDCATMTAALLVLAVVRIPRPPGAPEGAAARPPVWREAAAGWSFVRRRRGLVGLLLLFAAANFSLGMLQVLLTPLVLAFASTAVLGAVLSVAGAGMLAGSVVMSLWGGPRRRVVGILGCLALMGTIFLLGGARPNAALIAGAAFVVMFALPVLEGCSQAIWQTKVAPALQGRVFAVRSMVSWSAMPLAYLLAGPLADHVFEPLLASGGPLAASLGRVVGVGPGRGIGLLFVLVGVLLLCAVAAAWRSPAVRGVERDLPDAVP